MRGKKKRAKKAGGRKTARKRRKVAAKKAAKKSAKKAAKKAAKKGGGGGKGGKLATIVIDPQKSSSKKAKLSRSKGNRIRWENKDTIDHWVRFVPGEWPFGGTQHDIFVPTGGTSETLTVRSDAIRMQYDNEIIPEVEYDDIGTTPDGPAIIVDD